jgi:hypothetical protein
VDSAGDRASGTKSTKAPDIGRYQY